MTVSFEKKKKSGLRKCKGHWERFLRHSRLKKNFNKEDRMINDCYEDNGLCRICGGYKKYEK